MSLSKGLIAVDRNDFKKRKVFRWYWRTPRPTSGPGSESDDGKSRVMILIVFNLLLFKIQNDGDLENPIKKHNSNYRTTDAVKFWSKRLFLSYW